MRLRCQGDINYEEETIFALVKEMWLRLKAALKTFSKRFQKNVDNKNGQRRMRVPVEARFSARAGKETVEINNRP